MLRSQLLKGTLPLMILSVIGDGELYGYEIAQRIRERSAARLAPGEGSLYPALHRLEHDGALVGSWRAGSQGPRRRYYRVTPTGLALLEASREEWNQVTGIVAAVAGSGS